MLKLFVFNSERLYFHMSNNYYQVEDIMKEKNMETLDPNETVFVSEDFNYFGSFDPPIGYGTDMSTALKGPSKSTASLVGVAAGSSSGDSKGSSSDMYLTDCISTLAFFIFER
jgi:hypothetical protein